MVGLSTVTYLNKACDDGSYSNSYVTPVNETVPKLPISDCRGLALRHLPTPRRGSLYLEVLAYETICNIYKTFYRSLLTKHRAKNTFQNLKNMHTSKSEGCSTSTAASLIYKPKNKLVQIVPDLGNFL